jgi:selenide,water dikinase
VYLLDERTALVQTVDVFTPPVDDPYAFGQIAAANSLSDVYAMGGRPITALSIVGFPTGKLPDEVLRQILRGGLDKMSEAGVPVIGGHSIKENEIKAGFAVTGLIDPRRVASNAAARPGDRLVLTKPLGTGIIAFAARIGRAEPGSVTAATRSMSTLNRRAAELMGQFEVHACTDVTGFGLLGHLKSMAAASKVDVELAWEDIPLMPGVLACAAAGIIPGSVERNRDSSGDALAATDGADPACIDILFDPQTSGGLLISLPSGPAEELVARLRAEGMEEAAVIGRVVAEGTGRISVCGRGSLPLSPQRKETDAMNCCGDSQVPAKEPQPAADAPETPEMFHAFLQAANAPGALGSRTKRAMAISLSVLARCSPCVKYHVRKAKEENFSPAEIDEAVWMAIAFGGSPAMMFYNELKASL